MATVKNVSSKFSPTHATLQDLQIEDITIVSGFNERGDFDHIPTWSQGLKGGIEQPVHIIQVVEKVDEKQGKKTVQVDKVFNYLVDGECRVRGAQYLLENDNVRLTIPALVRIEKEFNALDWKADQVMFNSGTPFTMLQQAGVFAAYRESGLDNVKIAAKCGTTKMNVGNALKLYDLPADLKALVKAGRVAGTTVIELLKNKKKWDEVTLLAAINALIEGMEDGQKVTPKMLDAHYSANKTAKNAKSAGRESGDETEEEGDELDLNAMDRDQLKQYIADNELDIKVTKKMTDDEIRAAILALIEEEEEEEETPAKKKKSAASAGEEEEEEEEPAKKKGAKAAIDIADVIQSTYSMANQTVEKGEEEALPNTMELLTCLYEIMTAARPATDLFDCIFGTDEKPAPSNKGGKGGKGSKGKKSATSAEEE